MNSSSEQKAWLWGVGAAVVGFLFLIGMVRPFGGTLAPARCWSGVSDSNLAAGLLCDVTSSQVGQCTQWFGAKAINDSGEKNKLKACVGVGELMRDANVLVLLLIAGLFGAFVGHESLQRSRKAHPPAQTVTGTGT